MPEDIFCKRYRDIASALKAEPSVEKLADIIDNPVQNRETFERATAEDLAGERALVTFMGARDVAHYRNNRPPAPAVPS